MADSNPNATTPAAPTTPAVPDGITPAAPAQLPAPAQTATSATPAQASANDMAAALLSALDSRTKRAETSVLKSMAEQYGMAESELSQILETEKAKRAAQLPPEQQQLVNQQITQAHTMLITADVKSIGTGMGLVDAEAAMLLLDQSGIKVDEKGSVTGTKEALEALQTAKPYLFTAATSAARSAPGITTGVTNAPSAATSSPGSVMDLIRGEQVKRR